MMKNFKVVLSVVVISGMMFVACDDNKSDNSTSTETTEEVQSRAEVPAEVEETKISANNSDTITLPSGLKMIITKEGTGARPSAGKKVKVHYSGFFTDGTQFDSSIGKQPLEFNIGTGMVIQGWDEGIALMSVGTMARLIIPHQLAYGEKGYAGVIPPSATLIFDVELLGVE